MVDKKKKRDIQLDKEKSITEEPDFREEYFQKLKEWKIENHSCLNQDKRIDFFNEIHASLAIARANKHKGTVIDITSTIKRINVELTTKCSSNCKFCGRQMDKVNYSFDLPLKTFKKLPIEQFGLIILEGTLGDPVHYPFFMDVINEIISRKGPKLNVRIHTNGNIHNEEWWSKLGQKLNFNKDNIVMFGVDGLSDTHSKHRKGTNFERIIKNIKAFTDSGGVAGINMIIFKHNEHQINDLKKLSEKLGCRKFQARLSKKYDNELEKPIKFQMKSRGDINKEQKKENFSIVCSMFHKFSSFLTADGYLVPCFRWHPRRSFWKEESKEAREIFWINLPYINLNEHSFNDILKNDFFQYLMKNLNNLNGCEKSCRFFYEQYFKKIK